MTTGRLFDQATRDVVARNVKTMRNQRGWSQHELGANSGVSQRNISKIERSESGSSIDTLAKLGRAFGVAGWALMVPPLDPVEEDASL